MTKDELEQLKNHALGENKSLDRVRDIFLFSCYSGLRYSDVQNLTEENIHLDSEGIYWIIFTQKKTNDRETLPMLAPCVALYNKYERDREITGYILPQMSNTKVNTYLKTIADLVGIKKKLTHHIARHTFATTIIMEHGYSREIAGAFLGHKDARSTMIYAKMTPSIKAEIVREINEKLERN